MKYMNILKFSLRGSLKARRLGKCGGHGSYRVLRRAHVDERPVRFRAAHSHEVESCFILAAQV